MLNCEIFDTMQEARGLIEKWRAYYNTARAGDHCGHTERISQAVFKGQHQEKLKINNFVWSKI